MKYRKNRVESKVTTVVVPTKSVWKDIAMLIKFRLTALVVMTSLFSYLIVASNFNWLEFIFLSMGGFAITSAANILNEILEKEPDSLMSRTLDRPVAANRLSVTNALLLSGVLLVIGILMLGMLHPLVSFLGVLSLVLYVFLYTPMKRYTPASLVVGAIPGAMPMLIGAVAAQKEITMIGMVLFTIQFLWQFPHFLAIGFLGFEDYKRAGFKNVPEKDGQVDRMIGMHAMIYTAFLLGIVILPFNLNVVTIWGVGLGVVLTVLYLLTAFLFHLKFDRKTALIMMLSSFAYLPLILTLFWIFRA